MREIRSLRPKPRMMGSGMVRNSLKVDISEGMQNFAKNCNPPVNSRELGIPEVPA